MHSTSFSRFCGGGRWHRGDGGGASSGHSARGWVGGWGVGVVVVGGASSARGAPIEVGRARRHRCTRGGWRHGWGSEAARRSPSSGLEPPPCSMRGAGAGEGDGWGAHLLRVHSSLGQHDLVFLGIDLEAIEERVVIPVSKSSDQHSTLPARGTGSIGERSTLGMHTRQARGARRTSESCPPS